MIHVALLETHLTHNMQLARICRAHLVTSVTRSRLLFLLSVVIPAVFVIQAAPSGKESGGTTSGVSTFHHRLGHPCHLPAAHHIPFLATDFFSGRFWCAAKCRTQNDHMHWNGNWSEFRHLWSSRRRFERRGCTGISRETPTERNKRPVKTRRSPLKHIFAQRNARNAVRGRSESHLGHHMTGNRKLGWGETGGFRPPRLDLRAAKYGPAERRTREEDHQLSWKRIRTRLSMN